MANGPNMILRGFLVAVQKLKIESRAVNLSSVICQAQHVLHMVKVDLRGCGTVSFGSSVLRRGGNGQSESEA